MNLTETGFELLVKNSSCDVNAIWVKGYNGKPAWAIEIVTRGTTLLLHTRRGNIRTWRSLDSVWAWAHSLGVTDMQIKDKPSRRPANQVPLKLLGDVT